MGTRSRRLSETRPKPLMLLGLNFSVFSECLLIRKENCSDFDSAIPRFEILAPQPVRALFQLDLFGALFVPTSSFRSLADENLGNRAAVAGIAIVDKPLLGESLIGFLSRGF